MLFGHLAVSALEHRYVKAALVPVTAAAIFPDAIDKVAHYALGHNSTGRMWGHTLLALLLSSLTVLALFGKHNAASWGLGYLSHLICDMEGVVPWLAPFVTYDFPPTRTFVEALSNALYRPLIVLEILLTIWAVMVLRQELETGQLRLRNPQRARMD
jgi:hypothetical protein